MFILENRKFNSSFLIPVDKFSHKQTIFWKWRKVSFNLKQSTGFFERFDHDQLTKFKSTGI